MSEILLCDELTKENMKIVYKKLQKSFQDYFGYSDYQKEEIIKTFVKLLDYFKGE